MGDIATRFDREYGTETSCPKNEGRKHKPDWHTVSVEPDGDSFYVDVNCRYCGRSGCIGTDKRLEAAIDW